MSSRIGGPSGPDWQSTSLSGPKASKDKEQANLTTTAQGSSRLGSIRRAFRRVKAAFARILPSNSKRVLLQGRATTGETALSPNVRSQEKTGRGWRMFSWVSSLSKVFSRVFSFSKPAPKEVKPVEIEMKPFDTTYKGIPTDIQDAIKSLKFPEPENGAQVGTEEQLTSLKEKLCDAYRKIQGEEADKEQQPYTSNFTGFIDNVKILMKEQSFNFEKALDEYKDAPTNRYIDLDS
jgi:hypothetical protein